MILSELVAHLGAKLIGNGQTLVTGINTIQDAQSSEICFLSSPKHKDDLQKTQALGVLLAEPLADCGLAQIVVGNINNGLIKAMQLFAPRLTDFVGIHPSAVVEANATVDPSAVIGPNAYVGHGVKIGAQTVLGPGCSVGENSIIGAQCRLDSNVVIYHNCQIGNACIILANTTIGATGFGYSYLDGQHRLIPHNGGVVIEDGVDIGANTCIDRAKFGNTRIGAGTKIDNFCQIAHNVQIGRCCLLAGQAAVSGSTVIGDGVVLAGAAGISDNRSIGHGALLGARCLVVKDVAPGEKVWGQPAQGFAHEMRCQTVYRKLPDMSKELSKLRKKVAELEARLSQ